jgi:hypothetical protein
MVCVTVGDRRKQRCAELNLHLAPEALNLQGDFIILFPSCLGYRRLDGRVHGVCVCRPRRVHLRQLPLAEEVEPLSQVRGLRV